ncbi:MAG: HEAT repeat domain-containing protein [Planctomycetota bacterium]
MSTLLPFLRPLAAAALLLLGPAATQSPTPAEALPSFAGHDAAWWNEQLQNDLAAREQLAVGAAEAMPLLQWLFEHGNGYARRSATRAMTRLGPGARRFQAMLLARLREAESGVADGGCAAALAAIGDDRDDVREVLMTHLTRSPDAPLRHACAEALMALRRDGVEMLLGAVAQGHFADNAWATHLLTGLGEPAVPALLAELETTGERGRVAGEALVGNGWPVAARLDEAGHTELAHRALTEGLLRDVSGADQYDILPLDPEPPAQQLPELEAALGSGHGHNLQVWRGAEGARGYVIRKIGVVGTYDNERKQKQWHLSCEQTTVPRELALGMTRQLRLLARLELQLRADEPETWWSSGDFAAAVRLQAHGEPWFEASFVGYPMGNNVPERYRAQAASHVLYQLARRATWQEATPDEGDRAAVASRRKACGGSGWSGERLTALEELLRR